jgi:rubrerythrin
MGTKARPACIGRALSEDEEAVQEVGVGVERTEEPRTAAAAVSLDDSGFVEFSVTGTNVSGEFRCADCGYGAVVHRALPPCPMCGGTVWESRGRLERPLLLD